jgi:hypothetical protein
MFNANISNISAIPWREQILYIRHLHIGTRIRRTGEKSQEALGQKIIRFLNTGKFLKIDIFFGILLGKIITLLLSKVRGRKYKCFSLGSIIPLINYKCFLLPLINYKHPILTPLPLFVGQ